MEVTGFAEIQLQLARHVILTDQFDKIRRVGGCDVSLRKSRRSTDGAAAIAVFSYPEMELLEVSAVPGCVEFPYVPGYLSFRELPLLTEAFTRLKERPDLLILDGHGLAHPRRFGVACHAGVALDIPTIGCAKSLFVGEFKPFKLLRGKRSPLLLDNEKVGYALCTQDGVKPIFVSPGHRISFPTAVEIVLRCAPHYRLPEPTRLAHMESRRAIEQ